MNNATEYELFTREIYQQLVDADTIKAIKVQHNVKLEGKSGQKHQIDVYWEYEIAGVTHKVAIEAIPSAKFLLSAQIYDKWQT